MAATTYHAKPGELQLVTKAPPSTSAAVIQFDHGLLLRTGQILESHVQFHNGPAMLEELGGIEFPFRGPPSVEVRIRALLPDNQSSDIFTEAASLADQLEQAGNDWGAGVVRRLAGLPVTCDTTPVEPCPGCEATELWRPFTIEVG